MAFPSQPNAEQRIEPKQVDNKSVLLTLTSHCFFTKGSDRQKYHQWHQQHLMSREERQEGDRTSNRPVKETL